MFSSVVQSDALARMVFWWFIFFLSVVTFFDASSAGLAGGFTTVLLVGFSVVFSTTLGVALATGFAVGLVVTGGLAILADGLAACSLFAILPVVTAFWVFC